MQELEGRTRHSRGRTLSWHQVFIIKSQCNPLGGRTRLIKHQFSRQKVKHSFVQDRTILHNCQTFSMIKHLCIHFHYESIMLVDNQARQ